GAAALTLAPAAAAAAAMPAGDYDFNLPGVQSIPVHVEDCGFECIKLTTPSGFKVEMTMNKRGDRYEGVATDPHGAMCNGTPMLADTFYGVDLDGTNGVVEVKGQPCGPGKPIASLIFALAPKAA
ncbi:MAG: hypothetical protein ABWY20_22745, partial [Mycobacterium sp.]